MVQRLLFSTFFCLAATILTGQFTFKKRFGTTGADRAWAVEVLPDNSFIVAGGSNGGGLGGDDAMLVKFSADGNVEWSKAYGGSAFDRFGRLFTCSDGNFIALGETNSIGAGSSDIYVLKFDANGNVIWETTCGGAGFDTETGICEIADGYIIVGTTQSFGSGNSDILVAKLDLSGGSMWTKAWGANGVDNGGEPFPAPNGDIWISGNMTIGGNIDAVLLRVSPAGVLIIASRAGGANGENMISLAPGGPGFVGAGQSTTFSGGGLQEPWLVGYNAAGGLVWSKRYIMPGGGGCTTRAEECPGGGFILAPTFIANNANGYLVKTDDDGNIIWAKSYLLSGTGRLHQVRPAPDGGFVAVGVTTSGAQDFFILKTDANGFVDGCCPLDAAVTALAVNPATPGTSPSSVNGPAALTLTGQNQGVDLIEVNLCTGASCCITDAGTMLVQTLSRCINLPAAFTHNGNEVLDANDLLQFILFSNLNDTLGSIVATSNTPTFLFNPATMQTNVTYYIAAIAGNNVGGNVDLNDPCLDISNAAQLIWRPLPAVTFTVANPDVCAGQCTTVTANFTGTAPFTLTYTTSLSGSMTQTFSGNTGTFQVCAAAGSPPGSWVVQATALVDLSCACN